MGVVAVKGLQRIAFLSTDNLLCRMAKFVEKYEIARRFLVATTYAQPLEAYIALRYIGGTGLGPGKEERRGRELVEGWRVHDKI